MSVYDDTEEDGKSARRKGQPMFANPYCGVLGRLWLKGWMSEDLALRLG
jgi:hypothetical protein